MKYSLGNLLIGGFVGILIVTFAEYLFYGEFSTRGLIISIFTVLLIYLAIFIFQYQKKVQKSD
ncbi:hypothetical protein [Kurthia zopfii]|uniref:hypothetical protein n=1 Tax=Kurthia zopfii TaxID=1650 RepID=UPI000F6C4C09|nr:hypothetical protein [Kurthia zopfii]VEI05150.1 Uncharacterised protein [Kurthia zopfii]